MIEQKLLTLLINSNIKLTIFEFSLSYYLMENKIKLIQKLVENVPGVIYQFERKPDGRYLFPYMGEGLKGLLGLSPEEVTANSDIIFAKVMAEDLEPLLHSIEKSASEMIDWNNEFRCHMANGMVGWIHGYARPEALTDGSVLWHGYLYEVTDKKALEEELLKISRLNLLMGKINTMIIHAKDLESLFAEACEIAVVDGNFKMAWIGLIDSRSSSISMIKSYGDTDHYLENATPISLINEPFGPTARSILERKTIVNSDTRTNENYSTWRCEALKRNFYSSISLPLIVKGIVIGSLNIYSDKEGYFKDTEKKLLEEIAQNVSYAVDVLEKEKALIQSEYSFRTIFEAAPVGIAVMNTQFGHLIKSNLKFIDILDLTKSDIASINWMHFIQNNEQNSKIIKSIVKKDGSTRWIEISAVPLFKEGDTVIQHLCMLEDISDRIKYEEDLKHALKSRDEFFSIASHELKTPITSLKLQVQLMKRDLQKDLQTLDTEQFSKHTKALEMASRQADRLTFLVDNLLDVTRIGAGHFQIKPLKCNLSNTLQEIIERLHGLIAEAENEFFLDIEHEVTGFWDQGRIEQVFVNLISNAIKYAPGEPVRISLRAEGNEAVFKIIDSGPGLPPESLQKVFNQFERVESSVRNISGLGLGLFIAKKIIDEHRGEISIFSELGKGATFTVKLPLK